MTSGVKCEARQCLAWLGYAEDDEGRRREGGMRPDGLPSSVPMKTNGQLLLPLPASQPAIACLHWVGGLVSDLPATERPAGGVKAKVRLGYVMC